MLVEVETKLVEFTRPSVEDEGLEVDRSKVNKVHELAPDLVGGQLTQLWPDRDEEVAMVVGERSSAEGMWHTLSRVCALIIRTVNYEGNM